MYNEHNNIIKWSYFEELVKVQNNEKLHVGCRATNRHLNWKREKMSETCCPDIEREYGPWYGIFTQE